MTDRDQTTPDFARIWLEPRPGTYPDGERNWCQHDVWDQEDYSGAHATEYVRADLVRKLLDGATGNGSRMTISKGDYDALLDALR